MQAQCPHCGSEVELPPDTTRAVCESCKRAFSLPAGAETLTEAADALPTGVPTISQPKVRINCPRCNAELTVPMGQLEAACPRCGEAVPLEPSAGAGSGGQRLTLAQGGSAVMLCQPRSRSRGRTGGRRPSSGRDE